MTLKKNKVNFDWPGILWLNYFLESATVGLKEVQLARAELAHFLY
jgi:hypothetical protein